MDCFNLADLETEITASAQEFINTGRTSAAQRRTTQLQTLAAFHTNIFINHQRRAYRFFSYSRQGALETIKVGSSEARNPSGLGMFSPGHKD